MLIKDKLPLIFGVPGSPFFKNFKAKHAFVAELRPGCEGMRAVAKEMLKNKITPVVICDNMMAFCMRQNLVAEAHIFYKNLKGNAALCRTGSLVVALCASAHNIPVFLHASDKKAVKKSDLKKINGKSVTVASLKAYAPLFEDVELTLVTAKE
jgi:methylthioribose-1-phosphate isomerase